LDKLHLIPKGSGFKVFNLVLSRLVLVQKQFGFCFEFSFKRRGRKRFMQMNIIMKLKLL